MKREIKDFNEIAEVFPWEPTFNKVIITLNTVEEDDELQLSQSTMSEVQYVIAVGPYVRDIKVNDKVLIDIKKMVKNEINPHDTHETYPVVNIDPIEHNGVTYAMISDQLIKAKYRE